MKVEAYYTYTGFEVAEPERLTGFKVGGMYEIEVKKARNPIFHKKVFAFFQFCFAHWCAENTDLKFQSESKQFDTFRRHLTVLAGYYEKTFKLDGSLRIEPQSLGYGNMSQSEFEECYNALINAAIEHIFKNCEPEIEQKLIGFF